MTRRNVLHYLGLSAGALATAGLVAGTPRRPDGGTDLLLEFRAQLADYPHMTPALLHGLTTPAATPVPIPDGIAFRAAAGDTVRLVRRKGRLVASIGGRS